MTVPKKLKDRSRFQVQGTRGSWRQRWRLCTFICSASLEFSDSLFKSPISYVYTLYCTVSILHQQLCCPHTQAHSHSLPFPHKHTLIHPLYSFTHTDSHFSLSATPPTPTLLHCLTSLRRFITHFHYGTRTPFPSILICLSIPLCHTDILSLTEPSPFSALFVPFPHSFATLSLLHGHRHILFPTRLHRLLQLGHTRSYIVAHSHTRFVTHTQSPAPLPLPLPTLPRLPAAAPMTSRRARSAARRGRRLAGRASAVLQSRRGSYNCGGMGGTDHCIAHL